MKEVIKMIYAILYMFLIEILLIIKGIYDALHSIEDMPISLGFLEFIGGISTLIITTWLFIER